jgi:hypothetical protein
MEIIVPSNSGRSKQVVSQVKVSYPAFSCVLPRADLSAVEMSLTVPESVAAPVLVGETVGSLTFTCRGETLGEVCVTASEASEKIGFGGILFRLLARFLLA